MKELSLKEKMQNLADILNEASAKYYRGEDSNMSDREYDMLYETYMNMEKSNPDVKIDNPPTKLVGTTERTGYFKQVKHSAPMLSLDNSYNDADVYRFTDRIRKVVGSDSDYVVEPKLDGLSIAVYYVDGILSKAITRGDGLIGDDVIENIKMTDVPHKLDVPVTGEFRGEVVMSHASFNMLKDIGEVFANPRNAAAGTIRCHSPETVKARCLSVIFYQAVNAHIREELVSEVDVDMYADTQEASSGTHYGEVKYLNRIGLKSVFDDMIFCVGSEDVIKAIRELETRKHTFPYDIDGAVVKLNSKVLYNEIGFNSKAPKFAFAYKYESETAITLLTSIKYQIGKNGVITPVAHLKTVNVCGTNVSRATLHNFNEVKRLGLKIGDHVLITKAAEIIPKVISVDASLRNGSEKDIVVPDKCPVCSSEVKMVGASLVCTNRYCRGILESSLNHFVSREALDIRGLGPETIRKLLNGNVIKSVVDIYEILSKPLEAVNITIASGISLNTLVNISVEIIQSKNRGLAKLLYGLCILNVGDRVCKRLCEMVDDVWELLDMDVNKLVGVQGFNKNTIDSLRVFIADPETRVLFKSLEKLGVSVKSNRPSNVIGKLSNKKFVITGSFNGIKREDIAATIKSNGGVVGDSVSMTTDYLVAGEKVGANKTKAAAKYEVEVISYDMLCDMIK